MEIMQGFVNFITEFSVSDAITLFSLIVMAVVVIESLLSKAHKKEIRAKNAIIQKKDATIQQRESTIYGLQTIITPEFKNAMNDMQAELKQLKPEKGMWERITKELKTTKGTWGPTMKEPKAEKGTWGPTTRELNVEQGTGESTTKGMAEKLGQLESELKAEDERLEKIIREVTETGNRIFKKGETLRVLLDKTVDAINVMEEAQRKIIRKIYKKDQGGTKNG